ncbi:hypothetical protein GOHSU_24_00060 [Gordonia hirsuta DSM 44140 = NBRC 16056]|uniref:Peptidase S54 rhomboid domain-containing protein n=1 Tax=Gordonia hirsuta DSM 44140 = NBRC 16056 TaxID=1121927 RepID=L7LCB1_9ACTN|nr:rhomboid family intramembrane serine protease [Gordonia hirsuta]GAC57717.1 hypothetical protein GOHSU_24_00060 [Gordonia hirsuta DSM 44140 = NBRC 16056]
MARESAGARVGTAPQVAEHTNRAPVVTYGLIAVNLVLFAAAMAQSVGNAKASSIMNDGALYSNRHLVFEYWRLLTSGFLHSSVPHLALNMISLYIVGRELERLFGPARYLTIYLMSLFGGSAAVLLFQQGPAPTVGASGAIYGLMGALLVVVLRLKLPATSVLVVIGLNIVMSISIPGISLWAHLGGLAFGALGALAVLWLPIVVLPPDQRTAARVSRTGWAGLIVLLVLSVAIGAGVMTTLSL